MDGYGDICTGRHCVSVPHAHLVLVTKHRQQVFTAAHLQRLEQIMRDVCADSGTGLTAFNGQSSHVHPLASFPPTATSSPWPAGPKGASSRRMREGVPPAWARHYWRRGPAMVRVVLRRIGRRPDQRPAPVHRTAEPARLTSAQDRLHHGLKAAALADTLVAARPLSALYLGPFT
jgi:putative transposase